MRKAQVIAKHEWEGVVAELMSEYGQHISPREALIAHSAYNKGMEFAFKEAVKVINKTKY